MAEISEITPLVLNNTIVNLRKIIHQARVRCVRKLVKHVKMLKSKKGTEEQTQKNKRKIEKLSNEIKEMKTLKPDEISKFALINTKSFEELIKTPVLSASQLALYKIAFCPLIVEHVDKFREKYPLWPVEVPFILQRLGLQYKSKPARGKPAVKNSNNNDPLPIMSAKNDKNTAKGTNDSAEISQGSAKSAKDSSEDVKNSEDTVNFNVNDKLDENFAEIFKENPRKVPSKQQKSKKTKSKTVRTKSIPEENQQPVLCLHLEQSTAGEIRLKEGRTGQMEVKRLKLSEISGDEIIFTDSDGKKDIIDSSKSSLKSGQKRLPLKNDPFFDSGDDVIDASNTEEVPEDDGGPSDNDLLINDQDDNKNIGKNRKILKNRFSSSLKRGTERTIAGAEKPQPCRKNGSQRINSNKDGGFSGNRRTRSEKPVFIGKSMPKRRQDNPNLVPLGKPKNQPLSNATTENRKQRRLKMRQEAEKAKEMANLHPSWQAKRKMNNPTLLPPCGKKIKFED